MSECQSAGRGGEGHFWKLGDWYCDDLLGGNAVLYVRQSGCGGCQSTGVKEGQ